MAVRSHTLPHDRAVVANDLPDDTEESLGGIVWRQYARNVLTALLLAISLKRESGWGVYEEIGLTGLRHRDRRPYTPRPDVMVLAAPIDGRAAEVALADVEGPLLVVEFASESTWANDVGDKRDAYEAAGAAEYIVFDPSGDYIAERVRAWRLDAEGRCEDWRAEGPLWQSRTLEVGFFVEGPLLRLRDRDDLAPRAALGELKAQRRAEAAEERARRETQARIQAEEELRRVRALLDAAQRRSNDPHPS